MLNHIKAVMLGHAIGDALGVPVEFRSRDWLKRKPVTDMTGFGTHNVPAGCWSDDTSMAICALESLSKGIVDYDDVMKNFVDWLYQWKFTATGVVFDVGGTCYEAISRYNYGHFSANCCGLNDEMYNGNGSLMRIHPFVLYAYYNGITNDAFDSVISNASSLTHAHQCSIDGCIIYAYVLKELLDNPSMQSVYTGITKAKDKIKTANTYYHRLCHNNIAEFDEAHIKSSGYIVDSLEAAVWCVLTTQSYKDCVLKAVNLGNDTDTIAAIAGSLAGALYGIDSIPEHWISTLKRKDFIVCMCENAYNIWRQNELQGA